MTKASNHTKSVSTNNQQSMTQPTFINLHPNEYSQGLRYYPFAVNLGKCVRRRNTLNNISNSLSSKQEKKDLNLHVFNIVAEINESKTFKKHASCDCKRNFDGRKLNSNQEWNNDKG